MNNPLTHVRGIWILFGCGCMPHCETKSQLLAFLAKFSQLTFTFGEPSSSPPAEWVAPVIPASQVCQTKTYDQTGKAKLDFGCGSKPRCVLCGIGNAQPGLTLRSVLPCALPPVPARQCSF